MNPPDSNSREQAFDTAVSAKLRELMPPPGLRDAILAGAQADNPRRRTPAPRLMPWLAAAAAIAVLAGGEIHRLRTRTPVASTGGTPHPDGLVAVPPAPPPSVSTPAPAPAPVAPKTPDILVASALKDALYEKHKGLDAEQCTLAAKLGDPAMVLAGPLPVDIPQLRSMGCRMIHVGARDVYELCFVRQGTVLHLYVAARGQSDPSRSLVLASLGSLEAATWSDAHFDYVLVGATGEKGMLHLMRVT